jgi:hypothetical protein
MTYVDSSAMVAIHVTALLQSGLRRRSARCPDSLDAASSTGGSERV